MSDDFMDKINQLEKLAESLPVTEWYKIAAVNGAWAVISKTKPEAIIAITHLDEYGAKVGLDDKSATYIAAVNPAFILQLIARFKVLNNLYGEIFQEACELRDNLERLEKEADWLAEMQNYDIPHEQPTRCPKGKEAPFCGFVDCKQCWRDAARKAVDQMEEQDK